MAKEVKNYGDETSETHFLPKDTRHLTNRTDWLKCASELSKTLDKYPDVADLALEFVVKARKPDFIPVENH